MERNLTDMLSRRFGWLSTLIRADIEEWNKTMKVSNEKQVPFEKLEYLELIKGYVSHLEALESKIKRIEENSTRKTIKVYMVGEVSVGKSSVINALLGVKMFTASRGHATSCFVCIKPSNECRLEYQRNEETISDTFTDMPTRYRQIDSLTKFTSSNCLRLEECLYISWRGSIAGISADLDVQFFDAPGFSREASIDEIVQQRCLDANILVMVAKTEPDEQEREFIKTHCAQSSKPDIFILVNCWDDTDGDDEESTETDKQTIRNGWICALRDCANTPEAETEGRIFFVSSREILRMRSQGAQLFGNEESRLFEFLRFERCLADCATKSSQVRLETAAEEYKANEEVINTITDNFINEYNEIKKTQTVEICAGQIEQIDDHIGKTEKMKGDELSKMKAGIWKTKQLHILKADKDNKMEGWVKKLAHSIAKKTYKNDSSTEEDMGDLVRKLDRDMNKMVSKFINIDINQAQRHSQINTEQFSMEDPQKASAGIGGKIAGIAETLTLANIDKLIKRGNTGEAAAGIAGRVAILGAEIGVHVGVRVLIAPLALVVAGPVLGVVSVAAPFIAGGISYSVFRRNSKEALAKEVEKVSEKILSHYVNVLKEIKDLFEVKKKMIEKYGGIDITVYLN